MLSLRLIFKKGAVMKTNDLDKNGNFSPISLERQLSEFGERMTTKEAAAYLRLQEHTLAVWRLTGRYDLRFQKIGRRVFYLRSDLDAWSASRSGTHTGAI